MRILPCSSGGRDRAVRGGLLGLVICTGSIVLSSGAFADTLHVPQDFPTIQRAIEAAVDGDVVRIKAGVYQPVTTIDTLGKSITIQGETGPGGAPLVTIDGRHGMTLLQCISGEGPDTLVEHLVLQNGRSAQEGAGMLVANASSPAVFNCTFVGNVSDCHGGAVATITSPAGEPSNPTFVNCVFEENEAICHGGGVYSDGGTSVFIYCDFRSNRAVFGGGLYGLAGLPILVECSFECNDASADGGGLHLGAPALADISSCTFRFNSAIGTGGGIFFGSGSQSLANSRICGNTPDQTAGVFFNAGGNTVAMDCPPCPDVNGDGIVNGADLALMLSSWGPCTASSCPADINADGVVDGSDLALILSSWGPCPGCP